MNVRNKYDTWTLKRPSEEFGKKTKSHAAKVSGYFLAELLDVLFEDMEEERAKKHYMIPAWKDFVKVSSHEEGVNPYSAGYEMTPSMIVLAQKDVEIKINKGKNDLSSKELRSLRDMHRTLLEARTYVGPIYEVDSQEPSNVATDTRHFVIAEMLGDEDSSETWRKVSGGTHFDL